MAHHPDEWRVRADLGSETHDALCDVVLSAAGYTLVNGALYEIMTWYTRGDESVWTMRRCVNVACA